MRENFRSFAFYILGIFIFLLFLSVALMDQHSTNVVLNNLILISVIYALATEFKFKIFNRNWISMFIPWLAFFGEPFGIA